MSIKSTYKYLLIQLAKKRWILVSFLCATTLGFISSQLYNLSLKKEVHTATVKLKKLENRIKTLEITVFELKTGETSPIRQEEKEGEFNSNVDLEQH